MSPETAPKMRLRSLDEAFTLWNSKHPEQELKIRGYQSVADIKAASIGKTIFAAFNPKTGWRIKEFGWGNRFFVWLARLFRYCGIRHQDTVLTKKQKLEFLAALVDRSVSGYNAFDKFILLQQSYDENNATQIRLRDEAALLSGQAKLTKMQERADLSAQEIKIQYDCIKLYKENSEIRLFLEWQRVNWSQPSSVSSEAQPRGNLEGKAPLK